MTAGYPTLPIAESSTAARATMVSAGHWNAEVGNVAIKAGESMTADPHSNALRRPRLPRGRLLARARGEQSRWPRSGQPRHPLLERLGSAARHATRPIALREGDPEPCAASQARGERKPLGDVAPLTAWWQPRRHHRRNGRRCTGCGSAAGNLHWIGRIVGRIGIRQWHIDIHRQRPVRRRLFAGRARDRTRPGPWSGTSTRFAWAKREGIRASSGDSPCGLVPSQLRPTLSGPW